MTLHILTRGDPQEKSGCWRRLRVSGKQTASISCPECGNVAWLDHDIADDGTVTPSLVCPEEACSFHEWVKLEGWSDGV